MARAIGLRLLTAAPRSRKQLEEALERRGVDPEVAGRVLDRFVEVGLVDDVEFARMLVRTRHTDRGLAGRALRLELRRCGIEDEIADSAISGVTTEQEMQMARALLERRLPTVSGLDRTTQVRRLAGFLTRKGYSPGLVVRLVREMVDDGPSADATEVESWEL